MTKKDFQLIADALSYAKPSKTAKPTGYKHRLEAWNNSVHTMADYLSVTNPRYDKQRFLVACGIDSQVAD